MITRLLLSVIYIAYFYYIHRLEVQADVTSTQRFSSCSETASAATSLSEKSVNASIALDDGAASTRALAGSVLNFKVYLLHILILSIKFD